MVSRPSFFKQIFATWRARLLTGGALFIAFYQFACDQFGFPTIPALWHMTGLPWWAWLFFAQSGALYGLFEYVRRTSGESAVTVAAPAATAEAKLPVTPKTRSGRELAALLENTVRAARSAMADNKNSARAAERSWPSVRAALLTAHKEKGIALPNETKNAKFNIVVAGRLIEIIGPLLELGHDDEARKQAEEMARRIAPGASP